MGKNRGTGRRCPQRPMGSEVLLAGLRAGSSATAGRSGRLNQLRFQLTRRSTSEARFFGKAGPLIFKITVGLALLLVMTKLVVAVRISASTKPLHHDHADRVFQRSVWIAKTCKTVRFREIPVSSRDLSDDNFLRPTNVEQPADCPHFRGSSQTGPPVLRPRKKPLWIPCCFESRG